MYSKVCAVGLALLVCILYNAAMCATRARQYVPKTPRKGAMGYSWSGIGSLRYPRMLQRPQGVQGAGRVL